ncbi:MAG TPA: hypothetical protein VIV13_06045, partial [Solirubrobacterales bacterium]
AEQAAGLAGIAEAVGEPLEDVIDAVRLLENAGMVDVVGEVPGGDGTTGRIYRAPRMRLIETAEWEELSRPERERISAGVRNLIANEIESAVRAKTFDARTSRHLARVPLLLDEQGWAELAELHTKIISDTVKLQAETLERLEESDETPLHARSIIYLFEVPDEGDLDGKA